MRNIYKSQQRKPILIAEIIQQNQQKFEYHIPAQKIKQILLNIFELVCEEVKKIPDLETKILSSLFTNKKTEQFIVAPILIKNSKALVAKGNSRVYPNSNLWLMQLYEGFSKQLEEPLNYLEQFKGQFQSFEQLLKLDVETMLDKNALETLQDLQEVKSDMSNWRKKEFQIQ